MLKDYFKEYPECYDRMVASADLFGPASFHNGDYTFYYNNIKDNVAKRIATYKESH